MKKLIKIFLFLFLSFFIKNSFAYILQESNFNAYASTITRCAYSSENIFCFYPDANHTFRVFDKIGNLITSDNSYANNNITYSGTDVLFLNGLPYKQRIIETARYVFIDFEAYSQDIGGFWTQYANAYYLFDKITQTIVLAKSTITPAPYNNICYPNGFNFDNTYASIFFSCFQAQYQTYNYFSANYSLQITASTFQTGTLSPTQSLIDYDKVNLANNYAVFSTSSSGATYSNYYTYLRDFASAGSFELMFASGSYIYKDGSFSTLGGISNDYGSGRNTAILSGSIVNYGLNLEVLTTSTGIINTEVMDNYGIIKNSILDDNIIYNGFRTPAIWGSGTDLFFIKDSDHLLYKDGLNSVNLNLYSTGSYGGTNPVPPIEPGGSTVNGVNNIFDLNFDINGDGEVSWYERLAAPFIIIKTIFQKLALGITTIFEIFKKFIDLSPDLSFIPKTHADTGEINLSTTLANNTGSFGTQINFYINFIKYGILLYLFIILFTFIIVNKKNKHD